MQKPLPTARLLSLAALVAVLALFGAHAASAAPKSEVTGNITVLSNVVHSTKQAGPNTKTQATAQVAFSGDLVGTATENYELVSHPDGSVNLHGVGFFDGTVDGQSGSLQYVFRGDAAGGIIVITHSSGGLEGTHGQIRYVALGGPDNSYSGRLSLPH
jgi:uncharacterized protein DUF3224